MACGSDFELRVVGITTYPLSMHAEAFLVCPAVGELPRRYSYFDKSLLVHRCQLNTLFPLLKVARLSQQPRHQFGVECL